MTVRRGVAKAAAFLLVVAVPAGAVAGAAEAKTAKAKATANCVKHPKRAKCQNAGGGSSTGSGGSSPQITLQIDPEPVVETGQSEVHAVLQVESLPSFAGDVVDVSSSQLSASCANIDFQTLQDPAGIVSPPPLTVGTPFIGIVLDDDGNATVIVDGFDCAPGTSVIAADMEQAPYLTALSTLTALPPVVTPEGVGVYPRFGGLNQELETGDTATSGESDIYAVFYVETNAVYAEQPVEIGSSQLEARCGQGWVWEAGNITNVAAPNRFETGVGANTGPEVQTTLDDDGNAVFLFLGGSCAAGPSQVIADVEAGTHPTYVLSFTVLPPAPII
ncbi:MAG: hypothetical protein ACRDY1_02620 [Acidimicrobiales bacterium]